MIMKNPGYLEEPNEELKMQMSRRRSSHMVAFRRAARLENDPETNIYR
jgi:hypothetical protein